MRKVDCSTEGDLVLPCAAVRGRGCLARAPRGSTSPSTAGRLMPAESWVLSARAARKARPGPGARTRGQAVEAPGTGLEPPAFPLLSAPEGAVSSGAATALLGRMARRVRTHPQACQPLPPRGADGGPGHACKTSGGSWLRPQAQPAVSPLSPFPLDEPPTMSPHFVQQGGTGQVAFKCGGEPCSHTATSSCST